MMDIFRMENSRCDKCRELRNCGDVQTVYFSSNKVRKSFSPNYNLTSEVREIRLGGSSLCDPPYVKFCFHGGCPCFLMKPYLFPYLAVFKYGEFVVFP